MTYGYAEATAVIGPLSPVALPGAFDLCVAHAHSVTVPVGWQMIRLVTEFEPVEPSQDDLTALADAIRATSKRDVPPPQPAQREVSRPAMDVSTPPKPRPKFAVVLGGESGESADGVTDDDTPPTSALSAVESSATDERSQEHRELQEEEE